MISHALILVEFFLPNDKLYQYYGGNVGCAYCLAHMDYSTDKKEDMFIWPGTFKEAMILVQQSRVSPYIINSPTLTLL